MPKVSVIIPAYNAAEFIGQTIDAVLQNGCGVEIVVVDDNSSDATPSIVTAYAKDHANIKFVGHQENRGAGHCRNVGMGVATGEYFFFLDADDILAHRAIDEIVHFLDANSCDVMVFKYRYLTAENGRMAPMLDVDENAWNTLVGNADLRIFNLKEAGALLSTVNFPWNKIVRADFCRSTGLFFSETRVHNDIHAHWHIYMHARRIGMLNRYLIAHRVFETRNQLTNVFTEKRFDIFKALDDVEALFARQPQLKEEFYHWFLVFKLDILKWIHDRLPPDLVARYLALVSQSYRSYENDDHAAALRKAERVAVMSLYLKHNPQAVFGRR